jgi:O-antigen/teichoic acid export membrane protein
MAYSGYGIWSLVAQTLISSFLILISNFVFTKWSPSLRFQLSAIKPLWNYGGKMFLSGALDTLYNRLDTFIIGKIFSAQTLGYYARAQSMDVIIRQFSANSIMSALFPYIARHQYDREYLKTLYTKYLHIICFVSIAMCGLLFLIARHLFELLFTSRWNFSAELFQIMSIAGFAWPVGSLMCNIISGVGNSKAFLRLEVYKKIIVLPVYLFGFLLGLKGFVVCMVVMGFMGIALNGFFAGKEINMKLLPQLKIVFNYFSLGVAAVLTSYFIFRSLPELTNITSMLFLSGCFGLLYVIGAYLLKLDGVHIINLSFHKLKVVFND